MSLKFLSNGPSAELFESEFSCSLVGRTLRCARGRYAFTDSLEGTFLWTSAVQSMSAVAIKSKIAGLSRTTPQAWPQAAGLCSDSTPWALSLDFALSKKPRWLLDMFGLDQSGAPIIKRLFIRMNPEKKRPGPTWVSINPAFLESKNIAVFLDGVEVRTESELTALLSLIGFEEKRPSKPKYRKKFERPAPLVKTLPLSFTHDANDMGILALSVPELLLDIVDNEGEVTKQELLARLNDLRVLSIPSAMVDASLESLTLEGVLNIRDKVIRLDPQKQGIFQDFCSRIQQVARQVKAVPVDSPKRSLRLEFSSLAHMDTLLSSLYEECLKISNPVKTTWWHLNHSAWPLLRPQTECRRSQQYPSFQNTAYVCRGNSPVDEWVKRFYQKVGVSGHLATSSRCLKDFWVIGDLYVEHQIPSKLSDAVSSFISSYDSVDNFDNVALERGLYGTSERCAVEILLAPGLTRTIRQQLGELSDIRGLRQKFEAKNVRR
jgi:hypothetical protein